MALLFSPRQRYGVGKGQHSATEVLEMCAERGDVMEEVTSPRQLRQLQQQQQQQALTPQQQQQQQPHPHQHHPHPSTSETHLSMKLLFLEERLHQMGEGIHPDMAETLKAAAEQQILVDSLTAEVASLRESSTQNDSQILKLKAIISEQGARLQTLQEEEQSRSHYQHTTPQMLPSPIPHLPGTPPNTASMVSLRCGGEVPAADVVRLQQSAADSASEAASLRTSLDLLQRNYAADVGALKAKLLEYATSLKSLNRASISAEEATIAIEKLSQNNQILQINAERSEHNLASSKTELQTAKTAHREAVLLLRQELKCREEEVAAGLRQQRALIPREEVDKLLAKNSETWEHTVRALQSEVARQQEEVSLSVAREERKNVLLQEYHAALVLAEEDCAGEQEQ